MKKQGKNAAEAIPDSVVYKLLELVNYQAGAVVSRELVSRKNGTVTVFSFDKSQQLSEHTAPFDALLIGIEGELEVFISGQPFRVRKADMIIMPAGSPHSIKALAPSKMLLVMVKA